MKKSILIIIIWIFYWHNLFPQVIHTVAPTTGAFVSQEIFNSKMAITDANYEMTKIAGPLLAPPRTYLSEKWLGTWFRGYASQHEDPDFYNVKMDVPTFDGFTLDGYPSTHPLTRDNSKLIRAHIHTNNRFPSYSSAVNIDKILAGITYLLSSQVVAPSNLREDGGFIWWYIRPNKSTPNTTEVPYQNVTHAYETSHALRTMCESYLYFKNYDNSYITGLYPAIVKAADNLYRKNPNTAGDLGNSNYKGFAAWALSSAYKVTKDKRYLDKAKEICTILMNDQNTSGGTADGMWLTGGSEYDANLACTLTFPHDTQIGYHAIILRGLIETMDITPNTSEYASWKISLISNIKKAVNHVIDHRVALSDDLVNNIKKGMLRQTWIADDASTITCPKYAQFFNEDMVEAIAMLALYSKFHWYFSATEQTNLKNLLSLLSNELDLVPPHPVYAGWFSQYAYYADYLNALDNRKRIYPIGESPCPPDYNLVLSGVNTINIFGQVENKISSTVSINQSVDVTYAAGQEIVLSPGFTAPLNSTFTGFIYPCYTLTGGGGGGYYDELT